jgi:DNA end-binding protein Ku
VDKKKTKFDPSKFEDHYENALLEMIRAKKAGRKPPVVKAAPAPSNVVNLFDALKKSLAAEGSEDEGPPAPKAGSGRRGAKAGAKKRPHGGSAKRKSA